MHLLDFFDKFSLRPENAKELKGLILDLAIRGRLTEEWRKEHPINLSPAGRGAGGGTTAGIEPASVLLQCIQAEKARLVKEKKIKKEKPLPEITEEEIPFWIPDGWEWCRLGEISQKLGAGSTPKGGDRSYVEQGIKFFRSKNIYNWGLKLDGIVFITEEIQQKMKGTIVRPKDILLNITGGSIGRCVLIADEFDTANVSQHVAIVRMVDLESRTYIHKLITSQYFQDTIMDVQVGVSREGLSMTKLKEFLIPLPPLPEQQAIVAIVNQLMAEVDELQAQTTERAQLRQNYVLSALRRLTTEDSEAAWQRLQPHVPDFFDTVESIDKLKEAILQLAVQGKLTKQWRKENPITLSPSGGGAGGGTTAGIEPASVLLQRIQAEKARLIKEKKIKKEKPLPEITEAEIPFGLPEGWEWCRVIDLVSVGTGATPLKSNSSYYDGSIPWFTSSSTNKLFADNPETYITDLALQETNCKIFPIGTLLVAMYGQGKTRGQITELLIDGASNQAVAALLFYESSKNCKEYIKYFFRKIYTEIRQLAEGGAQPNLNVGKIKSYKIPLPPMVEQKAIVQIVNQLMDYCDEMKAETERRNALSKDFLQASVREVMG